MRTSRVELSFSLLLFYAEERYTAQREAWRRRSEPLQCSLAYCRCVCPLWYEAYHLGMNGIHPECPDSDPSDRSVAANVFLRRQEPDEEDEEDDDDNKEDDDDGDTTDDGYSE